MLYANLIFFLWLSAAEIMYDISVQATGSPLLGIILFAVFPYMAVFFCTMTSMSYTSRYDMRCTRYRDYIVHVGVCTTWRCALVCFHILLDLCNLDVHMGPTYMRSLSETVKGTDKVKTGQQNSACEPTPAPTVKRLLSRPLCLCNIFFICPTSHAGCCLPMPVTIWCHSAAF